MEHSNLFLVIFFSAVFCSQKSYYWREYTGVIPPDAIIVGHDISGQPLYVGQAYVKNEGLVTVAIYKGVKEVFAPIKGIKKIDRYIKIMCGPQADFRWVATDPKHIQVDLTDKNVVIGGFEDGGYTYIGRISYEAETKVGKVAPFEIGNSGFYFHDRGQEKKVEYGYEVLYYEAATGIKPRIQK